MGEQLTNRTAKMTSGGTCLLHHENNANSRSHHAVQSQYASPSCPQTPPLLVVSLSPSSRATIALQILEGTSQQALFRMRLWLNPDVQPPSEEDGRRVTSAGACSCHVERLRIRMRGSGQGSA